MKKIYIVTAFLLILFVSISYAQTITVTSPHSGDTWYKGGSYTITWTHTGDMNEYVKIRLYQGSTKILGITDRTENDGSYRWTVPEDLPTGRYYIRVKTIDNGVYDDGDTFTISEPEITVTSPTSTSRWQKGNEYEIRWERNGAMNSNVKIRLYQGSTKILGITDSTNNNGSYRWTVPSDLPAGTYKIRVKTVDNRVYDDSDNFEITEQASPSSSITVVYPNGGERIEAPGSVTVRWQSTGNIRNVKILAVSGAQSFVVADSVSNTGSYNVSVPDNINNGNYKLRIEDAANSSVFDESDNTFEVYHPAGPPYIRIIKPVGGVELLINSGMDIVWETGRFDGNVKVELWLKALVGETKIGTIVSQTNDSRFHWNVGVLTEANRRVNPGNGYFIKITANNVPNLSASSAVFSITDNTNPTPQETILRVIKPNGGEKILRNFSYKIKWFSKNIPSTHVSIYLITANNSTSYLLAEANNRDGNNELTLKLDKDKNNNPISPGNYRLKITDGRGHEDFSDNYFALANPPHTIIMNEGNRFTNVDLGVLTLTYSISSQSLKAEIYCDSYRGSVNYTLGIEPTYVTRIRSRTITGRFNIDSRRSTHKEISIPIPSDLVNRDMWCYRFYLSINDRVNGVRPIKEKTYSNNNKMIYFCKEGNGPNGKRTHLYFDKIQYKYYTDSNRNNYVWKTIDPEQNNRIPLSHLSGGWGHFSVEFKVTVINISSDNISNIRCEGYSEESNVPHLLEVRRNYLEPSRRTVGKGVIVAHFKNRESTTTNVSVVCSFKIKGETQRREIRAPFVIYR